MLPDFRELSHRRDSHNHGNREQDSPNGIARFFVLHGKDRNKRGPGYRKNDKIDQDSPAHGVYRQHGEIKGSVAGRNLRPEIRQQDQNCSATSFQQVLRLHVSVIPQQKKEYATVTQRLARNRIEIFSEALQERSLVEVRVKRIASATELPEADVGRRAEE